MTAQVQQEPTPVFVSGPVSSVQLAFSANVLSGSVVHCMGTGGSGSTTFTFKDANNGNLAYTVLDTLHDTNDNQSSAHAYYQYAAAPGAIPKVTVTFSAGSLYYCGIWIREISGVVAGALDGHGSVFGDLVTSQSFNVSNANEPAFLSALGMTSYSGTQHPTFSSPLTDDVTGWSSQAQSAHEPLTTTGSNTITATVPTQDRLHLYAAIFDAGGGGIVEEDSEWVMFIES